MKLYFFANQELIRERSDIVLPKLRTKEESIQVCLFDKVLEIGGLIIFVEANSGITEKVIRHNTINSIRLLTQKP
jgi:hypothetical protein